MNCYIVIRKGAWWVREDKTDWLAWAQPALASGSVFYFLFLGRAGRRASSRCRESAADGRQSIDAHSTWSILSLVTLGAYGTWPVPPIPTVPPPLWMRSSLDVLPLPLIYCHFRYFSLFPITQVTFSKTITITSHHLLIHSNKYILLSLRVQFFMLEKWANWNIII